MHTCKTYVYLQLKINKQTVCVIRVLLTKVHWSRTRFASINIQLNQLQVRDVVWCRQAHFFLSNNCWLTIGVNTALRKLPTLPLHFTISQIAYSERKMIQPCEKKKACQRNSALTRIDVWYWKLHNRQPRKSKTPQGNIKILQWPYNTEQWIKYVADLMMLRFVKRIYLTF